MRGFELRIGPLPAGLEAAQIQCHRVGGPDIEPDGLAPCALHPKVSDRGMSTVELAGQSVDCSHCAISGARGIAVEL